MRTQRATRTPGKKVVGGGVSSTAPLHATIQGSAPLDDGAGSAIVLYNGSSAPINAYAWATCVNAS